jgi:hypothetical protein
MRIATFGSCLSRYTANNYVKLFGGKIVSSVYHNRSDSFVGRFIDKTWPTADFKRIESLLVGNVTEANKDNVPSIILNNQNESFMGRHRLSKGTLFMDLVKNDDVDLVIVDNYMDLAGRLVSSDNERGYFLRLKDFASKSSDWRTGEYLSPEAGVENMQKILGFFKQSFPSAKIVFINFPHNTYEASQERVERTKKYESLFSFPDALIIPCLEIPQVFQTDEKQHFKPQQYCAYAGIIWQHLTANKFERSVQ